MKNLSPQTKQIIMAAFVLVIIIWFIKRQLANNEQNDIDAKSDSEGAPKPSTSSSKPSWQKKYDALPSVGDDGLLKKGVKAKEVWKLQYLYNENIARKEGKSKIAVDGVFGTQTENAVKYVYEGKYKTARLTNWRKNVMLTKAQRATYFKPASSNAQNTVYTPSSTYTPRETNVPLSETTVINPYVLHNF
jgi:hypothetical protein